MIKINIDPSFDGMLLRDYLFDHLSLSNNLVKKAKSEKGQILINNVKKTVRYQLKDGDILQITFPPEQVSDSFIKSDIPLKILYEDDDIIIIDKQAGMPTIPSHLHPDKTIANGLLYYYDQIGLQATIQDRKSTRLNSSHVAISYAVFCLKKKKNNKSHQHGGRRQEHTNMEQKQRDQ